MRQKGIGIEISNKPQKSTGELYLLLVVGAFWVEVPAIMKNSNSEAL
jgi:hypothetical protein